MAINKCATIQICMYGHSSIPTLARGIAINMWVQGRVLLRINKYTNSETKENEYHEFKAPFHVHIYRAHCVFTCTHIHCTVVVCDEQVV